MSDLIRRQDAINAIKTWGLIDGLSEGQAIEILADEEKLPSAQPELIEKVAYIRGFEQGRTQGMIDAQGHGRSMPDERIKYI